MPPDSKVCLSATADCILLKISLGSNSPPVNAPILAFVAAVFSFGVATIPKASLRLTLASACIAALSPANTFALERLLDKPSACTAKFCIPFAARFACCSKNLLA